MIVNSEMFEESSSCFDPTPMQYQTLAEDGFSQNIVPNCNPNFPMEEQVLSYPQQDAAAVAAAAANDAAVAAATTMELELQHQMGLEIENCYNPNNNIDQTNLMQDLNHQANLMQDLNHQANWENHQEINYSHYSQIQDMHNNNNTHHQSLINSTETPYPQTSDLLNLFHLPRCSSSLLPNSTISFTNLPGPDTGLGSSVLYDPMFHLNLPPPPPLFREMFHSFPTGYNLAATQTGSLFDGMEERENSGEFDTGVLEFGRDMNCMAKGRGGKDTKHFATEKQRRVHLKDKYDALKQLVPNPSKCNPKPDRASVVGDAIDYIKELQRTVNELQVLVEKKRYSRERLIRRNKTEDDSVLEVESTNMKPHGDSEEAYNGSSLRSSWLQRKSKNTEVDVRIIDDEVTIKLVQQKRINCLLFVSKVLDELQLDLQHVAGGLIGDFYSFLFNTKIYEGSSVYASAIANKLIDVVDRQYAASEPASI